MPRFFEKRFNIWTGPKGATKPYTQKFLPKGRKERFKSYKSDWLGKAWSPKNKWGAYKAPKKQFGYKEAFELEKKKSFKRPYTIMLKDWDIQKPGFKKGHADFSKSRVYTNYGRMKRLGPHDVITISPTIELMKVMKKEQGLYRKGWLAESVKGTIDSLRAALLKHAEMIIAEYVPIETGDLQESLLKELHGRRREGFRLQLKIGTPKVRDNSMTYANPVNNMPERMLQHPHKNKKGKEVWRKGRKSRRYLYDPKAQHNWYGHVRMILNTYLHDKLIPAFYQNLIKDAIKKADLKVEKVKIATSPLQSRPIRRWREFKSWEMEEHWYVDVKNERQYIYGPKRDGRGIMETVGYTNVGKKGYTGEAYEKFLKEKHDKMGFYARVRRGVEAQKKTDSKLKKKPYKYNDVYGWFKVEIPFKR